MRTVNDIVSLVSVIVFRIHILCLFLLLSSLSVSANSADRVLPIRNEKLLEQLRTVPAPLRLQEINMSPDGRDLLYVESATSSWDQLKPGDLGRSDTQTLYLLHNAGGRKIAAVSDRGGLGRFRTMGRLKAQWSQDGRQFALLEQREGIRALWVYRIAALDAPERIPLPAFGADIAGDASITDWVWRSGSAELVLLAPERAVDSMPPQTGSVAKPGSAFSWQWSRNVAQAEEAKARRLKRRRGEPQCMLIVDLKTHTVRSMNFKVPDTSAPIPLDFTHDLDDMGWGNWHFLSDRRHVLVGVRDPLVQAARDDNVMRLLHANDPRGQEFAKARSKLYELDIETGAVELRYIGGPGTIAAAVEDRAKNLIAIESDPTLSAWPMWSQWGWLHALAGTATKAAQAAVPLRAPLFAAAQANVVYHTSRTNEPGRWAFDVHEVDTATGRRVQLNASDLQATAVDVSDDGRTVAAVLESVSSLPELSIWNSDTRRWRTLVKVSPTAITEGLGSMEHVTWRSKDDLFDVDGIVVKPSHLDANKRYPLIVLLQGGMNIDTVRFENRYDPFINLADIPAQLFAASGYVVLLPNHRGTAYSPREATLALIGHYGEQVSMDVEAGVDALVDKGLVDPERLAVMGHSGGGDDAMYAITQTTRYKAAVFNDAETTPDAYLPRMEAAEATIPFPRADVWGRERQTALFGYDPALKSFWDSALRIRTPVLLRWASRPGLTMDASMDLMKLNVDGPHLAGWQDGEGLSIRLLYALKGNDVPIDILIDRDNHHIMNSSYLLEYHSRLLQWFDYFLLGKGENPIPAMKSPQDYTDDVKKLYETETGASKGISERKLR